MATLYFSTHRNNFDHFRHTGIRSAPQTLVSYSQRSSTGCIEIPESDTLCLCAYAYSMYRPSVNGAPQGIWGLWSKLLMVSGNHVARWYLGNGRKEWGLHTAVQLYILWHCAGGFSMISGSLVCSFRLTTAFFICHFKIYISILVMTYPSAPRLELQVQFSIRSTSTV